MIIFHYCINEISILVTRNIDAFIRSPWCALEQKSNSQCCDSSARALFVTCSKSMSYILLVIPNAPRQTSHTSIAKSGRSGNAFPRLSYNRLPLERHRNIRLASSSLFLANNSKIFQVIFLCNFPFITR